MEEPKKIRNWYWPFRRKEKKKDQTFPKSEKIVVFVVCYVIAISLWLLVNLGREYTLTLELPISISQMDENQALASDPPEYTKVSLYGEGWKLLNIYNNPPQVFVNATSAVTNLSEVVQANMNAHPDVNVQKVEPNILNLNLEERVTKKVPVSPQVSKEFRRQFDMVGEPEVSPDSVEITGARSKVEGITEWKTKPMQLTSVNRDIELELELEPAPAVVSMSTDRVSYNASVSEFTEGEIRIYVRTRNIPDNREVRFSPSVITVKYDVSLEDYTASQDVVPYSAYVDYEDVMADTTGFVSPEITLESDELNLRLRSYQPRRVSYFNVLRD